MRVNHTTNLIDRLFSDDPSVLPKPGDIEIGKEDVLLACPGCGQVCILPFARHAGVGHRWSFDGNHVNPTLSPSIHHLGCWHGWLRAGELTPA
jgi:Family of unknown function (DUF6527)